MEPTKTIGGAALYRGDCLDVLGGALPGESVAACIADPPYGIDYHSERAKTRPAFGRIANDKAPYIWWIPFAARALRPDGCLACFSRWDVQDVFIRALGLAGLTVRSVVVWDKMCHGMGNLRQAFGPSHETVIFATKDGFRFPAKRPRDVISCMKVGSNELVHPNEKPVALLEELLDAIVPEGGAFLDPFMGSGAAGVACARTGRPFVGIEIDGEWFDLACRRIGEQQGR